MPDPATTFVATGIAAKRLVESVTNDLYSLAKSEGGFQIKKWKATRHVDTVSKHVRELRLVKTIWQIDKAVDLLDFYYPSKVCVGKNRVAIHQLADLGFEGNIILEGTVGQGKSILLRYLAATDFCINRRVPIFIELRKVRQGQSLEELALQELKTLGFEMTEDVFAFFANKGRLLLLLDAFDEVKEELKQDLSGNIERLIRQYEGLTVIITTRPDSGISASPFLRVYRVSELQGKEHEEVIRKMAHDSQTADAIIKGIRGDSSQVADLLRTPLMVALLMVRYRIDQSLPQNAAAFYESLFGLLLQRHDKSKGGWQRPRKSSASDSTLLDFFNALAFVTRKAGETSFTQSQLIGHCRDAISILGEKLDADKMLDDIVGITCLIIRDGEESRFIHKSVQEYHAALFIKGQPDSGANRFYQAMHNQWHAWEQELRFLRQIDRFRYTKHFFVPLATKVLTGGDDQSSVIPEFSNDLAVRLFGGDRVGFKEAQKGVCRIHHQSSWALFPLVGNRSPYFSALVSLAVADLPKNILTENEGFTDVYVRDVISSKKLGAKIFDGARLMFNNAKKDLEEAKSYVAHVEQTTGIFDLSAPAKNSRKRS